MQITECLEHARKFAAMADNAKTPEARQHLIEIANAWTDLATAVAVAAPSDPVLVPHGRP
jgi:phage anti-repressor protein